MRKQFYICSIYTTSIYAMYKYSDVYTNLYTFIPFRIIVGCDLRSNRQSCRSKWTPEAHREKRTHNGCPRETHWGYENPETPGVAFPISSRHEGTLQIGCAIHVRTRIYVHIYIRMPCGPPGPTSIADAAAIRVAKG